MTSQHMILWSQQGALTKIRMIGATRMFHKLKFPAKPPGCFFMGMPDDPYCCEAIQRLDIPGYDSPNASPSTIRS